MLKETDKPKVSYEKFCKMLGYSFQRLVLLKRALTHSSFSPNRLENNQRLEFLGDRVLGLSVARMLYEAYPLEAEGDLAVRLATLVSSKTLAEIALEIKVPDLLELSSQEQKRKGFKNKNILADSMEAVLGAIMMDSDFSTAYGIVEKFWMHRVEQSRMPMKDFKTKLQEITQKIDGTHPTYKLVKKDGPAHAPTFTLSSTVCGITEIAAGPSKKEAEQVIAMKILERLDQIRKEEQAKAAAEKKMADGIGKDSALAPSPEPAPLRPLPEIAAVEPEKPAPEAAAPAMAPDPIASALKPAQVERKEEPKPDYIEPGNRLEPERKGKAKGKSKSVPKAAKGMRRTKTSRPAKPRAKYTGTAEVGNRVDAPAPEIDGNRAD
ncbi:MAG: ribonuclease III [Rickettsiales bacterium]|jgi:ribonuclease-3|nr:ribonuclease III [Rickettsiales bacterium]